MSIRVVMSLNVAALNPSEMRPRQSAFDTAKGERQLVPERSHTLQDWFDAGRKWVSVISAAPLPQLTGSEWIVMLEHPDQTS
jgi:hypothetical protein